MRAALVRQGSDGPGRVFGIARTVQSEHAMVRSGSLPVTEPLEVAVKYPNAFPAIASLSMAFTMLLVSAGAGATPVCRWVDDTGRTQMASTVPAPYQAVATCTDSQQYEISPEQRREAEQRFEADKARARSEAARLPVPPASGKPRIAAPHRPSFAKRPAEVVTEATTCLTWWRLYDESGECFGPYRTARGGTKAEAFNECNVVLSPESRCGPRSN